MATKYFSQSLIYNTKKRKRIYIFHIFQTDRKKTLGLAHIWKGEKDLEKQYGQKQFQFVKILASQIYTIRKAISGKSLLRGNNLISL